MRIIMSTNMPWDSIEIKFLRIIKIFELSNFMACLLLSNLIQTVIKGSWCCAYTGNRTCMI